MTVALLLALVGRSIAQARYVLFGSLFLLSGFQLILVGQAAALEEQNSLSRMAELLPAFVQRGLGNKAMVFASFKGTVSFGYDIYGNVVHQLDAAGLVTRVDRDAGGRPVRLHLPDGSVHEFTFGPGGELLELTTPRGKTVYRFASCRRLRPSLQPNQRLLIRSSFRIRSSLHRPRLRNWPVLTANYLRYNCSRSSANAPGIQLKCLISTWTSKRIWESTRLSG